MAREVYLPLAIQVRLGRPLPDQSEHICRDVFVPPRLVLPASHIQRSRHLRHRSKLVLGLDHRETDIVDLADPLFL